MEFLSVDSGILLLKIWAAVVGFGVTAAVVFVALRAGIEFVAAMSADPQRPEGRITQYGGRFLAAVFLAAAVAIAVASHDRGWIDPDFLAGTKQGAAVSTRSGPAPVP